MNATKIELADLKAELQYGIQICAIYSLKNIKNPFDIVPVIPFICHRCEKNVDSGFFF